MQIDVIGSVEGTGFMKCKLYADGRVCVFYMTESNYKALMYDKIFIRDGQTIDSAGVINTTNTFIEEDLWMFEEYWLWDLTSGVPELFL